MAGVTLRYGEVTSSAGTLLALHAGQILYEIDPLLMREILGRHP